MNVGNIKAWLIVCTLLIVGVVRVSAQDNLPWPPDTETLFAPGVEVVSVEIRETPYLPFGYELELDDEARLVRITDTSTQQVTEYPYPDEVSEGGRLTRHDYAGESNVLYQTEPSTDPLKIWRFDASAGIFTPIGLICGQMPWASGWQVLEFWLYQTLDNGLYVCFTGDGTLRGPINLTPEELGCIDVCEGKAVVSPDGQWLFYQQKIDKEPSSDSVVKFFSYRLDNGEILFIGEAIRDTGFLASEHMGYDGFSRWMSDTRGTIEFTYIGESSKDPRYTFEVNRANSLQSLPLFWPDLASREQEPVRYEEVITHAFRVFKSGAGGTERQTCTFTVYDATGLYQTELGYDCLGAQVMHRGEHYFTVTADGADVPDTHLVRFDAYTGKITTLFTDQIEWLYDVSEDGRIAVMVVDDDGIPNMVDSPDFFFGDDRSLILDDTAKVVVLDTQTGNVLYEAPATVSFNWVQAIVRWCGADCLVVTVPYVSTAMIQLDMPTFTLPIHPSDDEDVTFDACHYYVSTASVLSPDEGRLYADFAANLIIERATGKYARVFNPHICHPYYGRMKWLDDGRLELTLRSAMNDSNDRLSVIREAIYTLRIPALFDTANEP